MAFDLLTNVDLHKNQLLNALLQVVGADIGSPEQGLFYFVTADKTLRFYNGTSVIKIGTLDQISKAVADVDLDSNKLIGLSPGTNPTDAVNKSQLDGAVAGLAWKAAVRCATTAPGTLLSDFVAGDTIDGIVNPLAIGDRILIKNQADAKENGIYVVKNSGAPDRAEDANTGAELLQAAMFVEEGTVNGDTAWVVSTDAPITIGVSDIDVAQFTGGTGVSGGAGLLLTGSVMDVVGAAAVGTGGPGGGLKVNANDVAVDKDVVGVKFAADIGDGGSTTVNVDHNLGSVDVTVAVFDKTAPYAEVHPEVRHTSTTRVALVFAVAPTLNQYRCVVKY